MASPTPGCRRTFASVDLGAIAHNVRAMKACLDKNTELIAVVKADAYGHGAVPVSRTALAAGADRLAVAMAEEALPLREAGIDAPVLVIGPSNDRQLALGVSLDLDLCAFTARQLQILDAAAAGEGKIAKVHLKIDAGMGRVGARGDSEVAEFLDELEKCAHLRLEGMFTHFPCADSYADKTRTRSQHELFLDAVEIVRERGHSPKVHVSNSAAAQDLPELDHDAVRFGISLYGYPPSKESPCRDLGLKKAMRVWAEISHVKDVPEGASIGYGETFTAPAPMRVATVQIGYGDGYNRLLSNRGDMIVLTPDGPKLAPIVGRICMDMTMIDVTTLPGVAPGDLVLVMGEENGVRFDADNIADLCGTISYEVLLDYTSRLPRIYEEDDG